MRPLRSGVAMVLAVAALGLSPRPAAPAGGAPASPSVATPPGAAPESVLPTAPPELAPAVAAVRGGTCDGALDLLRQAAAEPSPVGARAAYLLGVCLAAAGQHEEARRVFLDASARHTSLAAWARLNAARAALDSGDAAGAVALSRAQPWIADAMRLRFLLIHAEALLRIGRPREAVAAARQVVGGRYGPAGRSRDAVMADAWWLLGQAAEAAGDAGSARSAYAMAWWEIPRNPRSEAAARRLRSLSGGRDPAPTAQARAARGLRLVELWERDEAERELALGVKGPLPSALAAEAWYQLGLLRLGTRQAVLALQQAVRFREERDRALFWLGVARLRAGSSSQAGAAWTRLSAEYPDSLWTARAIATRGRLAEAAGRWPEADRLYADVIDRYPASPRADEARWRRAWMRYQRGQRTEARALFLRYAASAPDAPRAAAHVYWAARLSAEAARSGAPGVAGRAAPSATTASRRDAASLFREAAQRYPLTFYGQRARARLGLPQIARPVGSPPAALAADHFHPAYEELAALGAEDEALEAVAAQLTDDAPEALRRAAADLYARVGDAAAAIQTLEPLIEAALSGRVALDRSSWYLAYPRAFWPAVVREASRHGVDPRLVLALIREESRFDPRAVSAANAVGLMQLLPSTARGVLGRPVSAAELRDPGLNVRAGTAYLAGLLRRYQPVLLAVAAYNAGPGGVRRHAALARADLDRFVEEFPYAETRAYVQRVMQSYGIYRWLYP